MLRTSFGLKTLPSSYKCLLIVTTAVKTQTDRLTFGCFDQAKVQSKQGWDRFEKEGGNPTTTNICEQ